MNDGIPVTSVDLMSPELAADPWPVLKALREQGPVLWHETYKRWVITTDQEVRRAAINFERFAVEGTVAEDLFGADAFIAMDNRARHNALREVWAQAFRRESLESLRPHIAGFLDELLTPVEQQLAAGDSVNISAALNRQLPTLVVAFMMGVPRDRLADVVRWSDALAGGSTSFVDEADKNAVIAMREQAKQDLAEFLVELMHERRARPTQDLISQFVHADATQSLNDEQIVPNIRQLLFAGNETTAKWLDHIVLIYGQRPDILKELQSDRSLIRAANEEVLRWQGVVGTLPRRVRGGAIEVAGIQLNDGDDVTCLLASANRDGARYENAEEFDIHRTPQPNMGFGVGLHNCLGSNLARLEAEMAVNAMLDRIPDYRICGEVSYSTLPLRGPSPVVITL